MGYKANIVTRNDFESTDKIFKNFIVLILIEQLPFQCNTHVL